MKSRRAKAVVATILMVGSGLALQRRERPKRGATDKAAVARKETPNARMELPGHKMPMRDTSVGGRSGAQDAQAAVYEALSAPLNVFISRTEYAEKILDVDGGVATLVGVVERLPREGDESQQATRERVRAIDLLEALAESPIASSAIKGHCIDTLERLVMRPLQRWHSKQERRAIFGDKMDSLTALIRIDSYRGMLAYVRMSESQRSMLHGAALLGLVDSGLSRTEAQVYVSGLGKEKLGISER